MGTLRQLRKRCKPLRDITKGDAKRWRDAAAQDRAENTVRKWTAQAKALFNAAIDDELIDRNPFDGLPTQAVRNRDRDYFVTVEEAEAVLAACPNIEWRLIFGLSRWAGLRNPSELRPLTWGDIHWAEGIFTVCSSKTERHEGHEVRQVPLWPRVRAMLEEAYELAEAGQVLVVPRASKTKNLATHMTRIVEKAGLVPWPKLFHNLRASRSTEVANEYGPTLEAKWIGHSPRVQGDHYHQVRREDIERACREGEGLHASDEGLRLGLQHSAATQRTGHA